MSVEELVMCAFCMESTDVGVFGDGVTLNITRAGLPSTQTIWAHLKCLDSRQRLAQPGRQGRLRRADDCWPGEQ
uniref:PARP-type domain-containing protein n=1 Tax=Streptomyces sp. NBC_01393 TaxID=2903851 RepID=A0AAU3HYX3_9ACTN